MFKGALVILFLFAGYLSIAQKSSVRLQGKIQFSSRLFAALDDVVDILEKSDSLLANQHIGYITLVPQAIIPKDMERQVVEQYHVNISYLRVEQLSGLFVPIAYMENDRHLIVMMLEQTSTIRHLKLTDKSSRKLRRKVDAHMPIRRTLKTEQGGDFAKLKNFGEEYVRIHGGWSIYLFNDGTTSVERKYY